MRAKHICKYCGHKAQDDMDVVDRVCRDCKMSSDQGKASDQTSAQARAVTGSVTITDTYFSKNRRRKFQKGVDQSGQTCVRFAWLDGSGTKVVKDNGDSADSQRRVRHDVSDGWTDWSITTH